MQQLQGALDWSWDLLEPWAKAALSQVSLFHGGFNLASAESVVALGDWEGCPAMFDILGELTDNSLLRKDQADDGSVRYGLLEFIRDYASDKLESVEAVEQGLSGPEAAITAQRRHAKHFSRFGQSTYLRSFESFDRADKWTALFQELDNLVAAISYGDSQTAPHCCIAALKILTMKGPVSLGIDIATQVLALPELSNRLTMKLELERSKCLRISGRMNEARALVRTPRDTLNDDVRPSPVEVAPQSKLAGELTEEVLLEVTAEANEAWPAEEDEAGATAILEGERLLKLGEKQGQLAEAEDALREAIAICDEALPFAAGAFRGSLSVLVATNDQIDEAKTLLETGEPQVEVNALEHAKFLCKKAHIQRITGQSEEAHASLELAQALARKLNSNEDSEVAAAIAETVVLLGRGDPEDKSGPDGGEAQPTPDPDREENEA